ncbi:C2H2-type zinc finger protein [Halorussus limi]|uniref:C2H2-type zinc finger protein n=1 Tax=Halorussus limi TaxID=2938695 RepID=A0A8U0HW62_9EURY|nr:C2H2-type zinc finger protein [Halorussus limi]UPV75320.1 C2H2-type zinc finger protein [Halorussus limi]
MEGESDTGERCDYCGATFDDEETYLRHLRDDHGDDLGPIEQRRVTELDSDDDAPTVAMYGGAVGALAIGVLLAYLLFFSGGGAGGAGSAADTAGTTDASGLTQPRAVGSVHYHGTINATIGGQELDFGRQRFQLQADAFHFENGEGERWHVHAERVTLAWAMQTLGIDVTNGTVTFRGTTYGDESDETARVTVNGESVRPTEYVLKKGDRIRIVANASG